jgi:secreted PhoX family phosphatase
LREPPDAGQQTAFVSDYVVRGVNAPPDFTNPDNLALDKNGNLFITEDTAIGTGGMDIWVALPPAGDHATARATVRFASLTDCTAEPSGIYFDVGSTTLFVNVLHRAGADLGVMIKRDPKP